jgi:predicted ATPase/DNA-binding XRE family transcriptional regulator
VSPDREARFGARLRRLREAAGLTQDELATRAGLTAKGISDLERGARRRPYPHTVRVLAEALQLSDHERAGLIEAVPRRDPSIDPAGTAADPARSASRAASGTREIASASAAPLTPLIGREHDLEKLLDILDRGEVRLVTLTGVGGTGKTRLAVEAARRAVGSFRDGAVFVALAPVRDPALVAAMIATTLGLQDRATSASEVVRAHLHDKHLLLVLDNVEHLLGAAPQVADLVQTCPQLTVLSTSRAPMRLRGEQELPVPPLPLPADAPPTVADLTDRPSARLFVERAQAASPAFAVTPDNVASIAAICRRVAGLPLALELAAVGTRFLDPAALLARLDRALSAGTVRDLPARQQTMVATLDWSHQLLSVAEAVLFRRLSVFTGDFTLEAAEAVGTARDDDRPEARGDVFVTLGRLVEQSLVLFDTQQDGTGRYRMLEPVRDYALSKLDASGETGPIRCAHAGYYTRLGEVAGSELRGPDQAVWLQRLDRDHEELRAVLLWATTTPGADDLGIRLALALRRYWSVRGRLNEGRRWLQAALDACPAPTPALRAEALEAIAALALEQGDHTVADTHLAESLELRTQTGDDTGIATALRGLAETALWQGDHERAALLSEQSITVLRTAGDTSGLAEALNIAGLVEIQRANYQRALALLTEGLAAARRNGDTWLIAVHLDNLGWAHLGPGNDTAAHHAFADSLTLCTTLTENWFAADCLDGLARLAAKTGDHTRAVRLWAAAERLCTTIGATTKPLDDTAYQRGLAQARDHLRTTAFHQAWVDGQTMDADQARRYALEHPERYP